MTQLDSTKKLLTVGEVAGLLGLGRSFVYSLVMRGQIKSLKLGRSRRVPVSAVDEFISRRLEEANDEEAR